MILLINASTLSGTGVSQVAISFIYECRNFPENEYHVFLSKTIEAQINAEDFKENFKFYVIKNHPIYGFKGFRSRCEMINLVKRIKPNCVFSVFGPSWWTPQVPHLMGYAYPHYVYPESPIFRIMPIKELLYRYLQRSIHKYYLRKNGQYYVCETEDVSKRLSHYLHVNPNRIFTVSNSYNHFFSTFKPGNNLLPLKEAKEFRFVSLCSPYLHKNLTILNEVIPLLKRNVEFEIIKFVVTIDKDVYDTIFSDEVKGSILNIGVLPPNLCPQLYFECDALFLPTLLECFSANYPEAMFMKKPILTSNLSFATSVCGDAALYFDPLDAHDIVEQIKKVVTDPFCYKNLINKGVERLRHFLTSSERAKQYLSICASILRDEN
jgi:glycosyltransferase involved in cell wall biosynthesis